MSFGTLYIVATPIGNLQDLSPRAIETLASVDLVLCEDTRHSNQLFTNFSLKPQTMAYHDHNERDVVDKVIAMLKSGKNLALVSDAGTPLINDPGYFITAQCHLENIKVQPIPGCCALITALCSSGLATDSFGFYGFLPAKSLQRKQELEKLKFSEHTAIYYESTHRIVNCLKDVIEVLGTERKICLARELTKQFETIKLDTAENILAYLQADPVHQKGEFVLIIDKGPEKQNSLDPQLLTLLAELTEHVPPKVLAKKFATSLNLDKKEIYDYLCTLNKKPE